ncbi:HAUS augmin-like complex subunit 8 isoform X2 [Dama dama]|uniref:HAUS augmin-like complex subunit 8 isoform X2 n=1 Tax=Dama dama TaxID=30532 RepID=UPI002A36E6EC|nr:HAUS augmin-like complex subunit 8 isoform X2 [Dama dama]
MADTSGRGAAKPPAVGPSTARGARSKGRTQGGRIVESRYLQYEKKAPRKASAADALKAGGTMPEGGTKSSQLQKSKDGSGGDKGNLQSTLLDGHDTALSDLDLSAIHDKSVVRKTPQFKKKSKKAELSSSSTDLSQAMEMMESQTLLLTLLTVKMENGLSAFEEQAEKNLEILCKEKEKLQKKAYELKRRLLLCQKKRELEDFLDAQIEMLSPLEAVASRFREQYKTFAMALDTTRHELPVKSVHLDGDRQLFLDELQRELTTTRHLLGELGIGSSEDNVKAFDMMRELREVIQKKDLELRRSFDQVLELSAEASKEAALINQEVWEEAQSPKALSRWYFNPEEATGGETQEEVRSPLCHDEL